MVLTIKERQRNAILRWERALTQNMTCCIVEESPHCNIFSVLGATNTEYEVIISNTMSCTCPDNKINHNRCKHIYLCLIEQYQLSVKDIEKYADMDVLSDVEVDELFNLNNRLVDPIEIDLTAECPICYEENIQSAFNCTTCSGIFHKRCMEKWKSLCYKRTRHFTCPLCRAKYF